MAKPEAQFISNIHRKVDRILGDSIRSLDLHKQSMYTPYSGGTPDNYYETEGMSLWIEYKFERKMPGLYRLSEKLSPLQMKWLNRAYDNRQNVAVVVGFGPQDVVVFIDGAWVHNYEAAELEPHIITRQQFASDLVTYMNGESAVLGGMQ